MKPRFLRNSEGQREWAIIPYDDYVALTKKAKLCVRNYHPDENYEHPIPLKVFHSISDGDHPIRAWRKYRGMTQKQVAEAIGVTKVYVSQIECGVRSGQMSIIAKIADVLGVTLDDLKYTGEE